MMHNRPTRSTLLVAAIAALCATVTAAAHADTGNTRAQVVAELRDAQRSGDVIAAGETGLKLNELYPQRYPHGAAAPGRSRADVQRELAQAMQDGTLIAAGEGSQTLRDEFPGRYPAVQLAAGKSRAQVKNETVDAIRSGDVYAAGEAGLKLNEEYPQRYSKPQRTRMARAASAPASSGAY